ncbi:MAG: hypothetical protein HY886_06825 [Deltaproteobacteria bacterium]|nr:hypothetical protein [Deltaproteobacteria bacterium]
MAVWILLILLANGIISFAYVVSNSTETASLWGLLATNFLFYLGLTQTGIVFSAIMRIAKSEWGRYFNRLGEMLTLSFIPVAFVTFIIIYIGGTDHLFWWAHPQTGGEHGSAHLSPWLSKDLFLWRNIVLMALFYATSYIYFVNGRHEEGKSEIPVNLEKTLNVLAGLVIFFYVAANTNLAWDFGMMIIKHWESTIYPAYYWVGNVFAGCAFVYLLGVYFISNRPGMSLDKNKLDSVGVLLLGFTLLWVYMFWSQHIVMWYGDMPNLTKPFYGAMTGNYAGPAVVMVLALFVLPFLALINKRVKHCRLSLVAVAIIICLGVWVSRYLMILPVLEDGSAPACATWTNFSLITGGFAATILSLIAFFKLFPRVPITLAGQDEEAGH